MDEKELKELKELLQSENLDIKELAQIAKLMKSGAINNLIKEQSTVVSKTSKPEIGFKVEVNYPDFTITKTTPRTTKQLVFMVSQNSYFIRFLNNDNNPVEVLNGDNYADFTSGMEEYKTENFWTPVIRSGKKYYNLITDFIRKYKELIIMGFCKTSPFQLLVDEAYWHESDKLRHLRIAYDEHPNIRPLIKEYYQEPRGQRFLGYCPKTLDDMVKTFGLNNVRDFLNEVELSLYSLNDVQDKSGYRYINNDSCSLRHKTVLDYDRFKEYILYSGIRFGYRNNFTQFITTWHDDLDMQERIYGYVKEKYPKNLQTHHDQIVDKYNLHREEINQIEFDKQVEETKKLTWNPKEGDYIFLSPQNKEDFIDEAHQQANCLASYVQKFTEHRCNILFMRNKKTPEVSEVTIEVVGDRITQALQASNKSITTIQEQALLKWAEKFKLSYNGQEARRPRAAG